MVIINECIKKAEDLITSHEQTRAGFVEAALEKNRISMPYIEEAKTLKILASKANDPKQLLNIPTIQTSLLTAAGLSDKSLKYFTDNDKVSAIEKMIDEFLIPAGTGFVEELVYRFLIIKGDSLGGKMRNLTGQIAEMKLKRKILNLLSMSQVDYKVLLKNKTKKKWSSLSYEDAYMQASDICAMSWTYQGQNKVLIFNKKIPAVNNNVDICLFNGCPETFDNGKIVEKAELAIMFGELKGGIDPAGADEHWKTGNSALERIRKAFKDYDVKTSFIGAAIEKNMASEIFSQLNAGTLSNAANLTIDIQLTNYCEWLIKLK